MGEAAKDPAVYVVLVIAKGEAKVPKACRDEVVQILRRQGIKCRVHGRNVKRVE